MSALLDWHIHRSGDSSNHQVSGSGVQVMDTNTAEYAKRLMPSGIRHVWFAAAPGAKGPQHHFDGRLEGPLIADCTATSAVHAISSPDGWRSLGAGVLAKWDFSREIPSRALIDLGPSRGDGRTVNSPIRAIRGAFWSGETFNWQCRPQHYAAIDFHSDDLDDCHWESLTEVTIPDEWPSGLYAARLKTKTSAELTPFIVRASFATRQEVAFLLPTFTYTSYGNAQPGLRGPDLGIADYPDEATLASHQEFGHSQYDTYADR